MASLNACVSIWLTDSESEEPIECEGVDYISFVNEETYGIPPLTPKHGDQGVAQPGDKVIYVNPGNIAAMEVEMQN